MIEIREVKGRKDRKDFIVFPKTLYHGDLRWVPPLWHRERKLYSQKYNPVLRQSDSTLQLAIRDGRPVGRVLVYIDYEFNRAFHSTVGFFGSFECRDDSPAALALLGAAERWLRERGMSRVRGPIHPVPKMWGLLCDGFGLPPLFLTPYNPPYYDALVSRAGYAKARDLLAYEADFGAGYRMPERFDAFVRRQLVRRPNLTVRNADRKHLFRDAEHIRRIGNRAMERLWGYAPTTEDEMRGMVGTLRSIIDEDAVWFVEDRGVPVGYVWGMPDINRAVKRINGNLFPFGFLRWGQAVQNVRDYRLVGLGVLPEYHNLGLDVLLYESLSRSLGPKKIRLEANYILEDNMNMRRALEKLGMRLIKRYRVYEKSLSPDDPQPETMTRK